MLSSEKAMQKLGAAVPGSRCQMIAWQNDELDLVALFEADKPAEALRNCSWCVDGNNAAAATRWAISWTTNAVNLAQRTAMSKSSASVKNDTKLQTVGT